jgi:hypothetical protein
LGLSLSRVGATPKQSHRVPVSVAPEATQTTLLRDADGMVTRFEPAPGLDETVAARFALPFVERLSEELLTISRVYVPDAKVWVTVRDERVRHTHVETDGQVIPENLRYKVPSTKGVGVDLGRQPRDVALPLPNRINCRCASVPLPGLLVPTIVRMPTILSGTRVNGGIESRFPRIGESHEGTSGDPGVPFMRRAIQEVAAAHPGARGRG